MKRTFRKIWNVIKFAYRLPAIIVHELCHIIFAIILRKGVYGIEIKFDIDTGEYEAIVTSGNTWDWRDKFVSLSPVLAPVIGFALVLFVGADWTFAVLLYQMSILDTVLPSQYDIKKGR